MQRIGIMQGRLLPPEENKIQCFPRKDWMLEFGLAAAAGLDLIEWIYDLWGEDANPIRSDEGIDQIRALTSRHEVGIVSICADYFIERPLIRATSQEKDSRIHRLIWLISRCQRLGAGRIVLPFVDNSSIRSQSELGEVIERLREILPLAADNDVEIHLETSLTPTSFAKLLDKLPFPNALVNYDTGNSASLGYDFREELSAYGERIGSVHIKDRVLGGGTVRLGHGNADVPGFLSGLQRHGYSGDLILQMARGQSGREVDWARHYRSMVLSYLRAAMEEVGG